MGKISKKQNSPSVQTGGTTSRLFSQVGSRGKLSLGKKSSSSSLGSNGLQPQHSDNDVASNSRDNQNGGVRLGRSHDSNTKSHDQISHDSGNESHDQCLEDVIPDTPKADRTHNATFLGMTAQSGKFINKTADGSITPKTTESVVATPNKDDDELAIPDTPEEVMHNPQAKKKLYSNSRSFLFSASSLTAKYPNINKSADKPKGKPAQTSKPHRTMEEALTDNKVPSKSEKAEGKVAMALIMADMGLDLQQRVQMGVDIGVAKPSAEDVGNSSKNSEKSEETSKSPLQNGGDDNTEASSINQKSNGAREFNSDSRKRFRSKGESPKAKRLASRTTPKKGSDSKKFATRAAEIVHNAKSRLETGRVWRNPDNIVEDVGMVIQDEEKDSVKENVKWGMKRQSFTLDDGKSETVPSQKTTPSQVKSRKNIFGSKKVCDKSEDALDDILSELRATQSPSLESDKEPGKSKRPVRQNKSESMKVDSVPVSVLDDEDCPGSNFANADLLDGEDEALDDIMNELKTQILSPVSSKSRSARPVIKPYTPLISRTVKKPYPLKSPLSVPVDPNSTLKNTPVTTKSTTKVSVHKKQNSPEQNCDMNSEEVPTVATLSTSSDQLPVSNAAVSNSSKLDPGAVAMETGVEIDTDLEYVAKGFSLMSPFKMPESQSCDDDPQHPPAAQFGRHKVTSISYDDKHNVILEVEGKTDKKIKCVVLEGFWSDVQVKEGDIVNVLGEFDADNTCRITDKDNLLVVHPDLLISGTSVVNCVHCMRKSVLNEKFKGCDSGNIYMLYGSIIHAIFQEVLQSHSYSRPGVEKVIHNTLRQAWCLQEMYGQGVTEETLREEIQKYVPQIINFVEKYVAPEHHQLGQKLNPDVDTCITKIADIEENVWSPRYGIKGKIDLTVEVKIHKKGAKNWVRKVMPLELKTGKASFSMEHKGQVTLYSMMFGDRRTDPESGLLLYLKEGKMETIPASHVNKRGLIQLRNELAHYLSSTTEKIDDASVKEGWRFGSLPRPISRENMCTKCPQLINCAAYQKTTEEWNLPEDHLMQMLVPETLSHLKPSHLTYFSHWCKLLHLEMAQGRSKGGVKDLWCKTGAQREQTGDCLSNLELLSRSGDENNPLSSQVFVRSHSHASKISVSDVGLNRNDSIVVSAENQPLIAIATGTITDIDANSVTLTLDRNLGRYPEYRDLRYRVDKLDYFNTLGINFTNLSRLLNNVPHCAKLRELIIERKRPEFDLTLSKKSIEQVKDVFKSLNKPQKTAILKVLMSQDYVLIKGYPGTGKTSTIMSLVRILISLGQSVLLASYTHSAVDNILLKLKQYDVDFLRMGRAQRIHQEVLPYAAEVLANNVKSVDDLRQLYHSKLVVATTCLGTNHVLFRQRKFDVCIVDEASQVLQPSCFGPLMCSDKFVLVGDPLQLAPVVQSHEARQQGLDESLFARLDDTGATYELNLQYRMNSDIMRLSNELVYGGALKCGNDTVSSATLTLTKADILNQSEPWMKEALNGSQGQEVKWLNTSAQCEELYKYNKPDSNVRSETEAKIVFDIVSTVLKCGLPEGAVGVITPYRQQVWLLRQLFRENNMAAVEVNTVDQYQGRDKELIIMSFVKSQADPDTSKGGILQDIRRLNVAITRAKHKLILIGCVPALLPYQPVANLIGTIDPQHIIILPVPTS